MEQWEINNRKVSRQIKCNDPALVKLEIGGGDDDDDDDDGYFPEDLQLPLDAENIGKNTHIKELSISHRPYDDDDDEEEFKLMWENFFAEVARNRSIQKITLSCFKLHRGEIFTLLTRFFKENSNFECLEIVQCELRIECLQLLAAAVAKFDSLKKILFIRNSYPIRYSFDHPNGEELVQALAGHSDLRSIILKGVRTGAGGCAALATLLQNPESKLSELVLIEADIGDDGAVVLAAGLTGNGTLKDLTISGVGVERAPLEKPLETGWRSLFSSFQSPTSVLENVDLSHNGFENEDIILLSNMLTENNSLKSINLSCNNAVTNVGWEAFSSVLQNPDCTLEELFFSANSIDEETINNLTNALVTNTKLRKLDILGRVPQFFIGNFTRGVWDAFSTLLQSNVSALEELHLGGLYITNATITYLANSLTSNRKLKKMVIHSRDFTAGCTSALKQVLCNTSSIMETYQSNHTLQELIVSSDHSDLGRRTSRGLSDECVSSLLQLNQENNKIQAARLKIIKSHFREGFTVPLFLDMELKVLPHAISWMGRDSNSHQLHQHFYKFIRSIPILFNSELKNKMRKESLLVHAVGNKRKRKMEN